MILAFGAAESKKYVSSGFFLPPPAYFEVCFSQLLFFGNNVTALHVRSRLVNDASLPINDVSQTD